jgi:hypothetical protein
LLVWLWMKMKREKGGGFHDLGGEGNEEGEDGPVVCLG